jgi:hypothetical protein
VSSGGVRYGEDCREQQDKPQEFGLTSHVITFRTGACLTALSECYSAGSGAGSESEPNAILAACDYNAYKYHDSPLLG